MGYDSDTINATVMTIDYLSKTITFQSDYISLSPQRFGFKNVFFNTKKSFNCSTRSSREARNFKRRKGPLIRHVFIRQNEFEADCETKKVLMGSGACSPEKILKNYVL